MLKNNDDAIETNTLDKQKLFRELEYELKNHPNNLDLIQYVIIKQLEQATSISLYMMDEFR